MQIEECRAKIDLVFEIHFQILEEKTKELKNE